MAGAAAEGRARQRVEEEELKDICPLLTIAFKMLTPCLREECAWWGGKNRGCAMLALLDLSVVAEVVGG
ncbi:MAG: hypothetical protein LM576_07935 [Thermofilum sp.]|nr:hypothetical protein [Thermofilum sp.]